MVEKHVNEGEVLVYPGLSAAGCAFYTSGGMRQPSRNCWASSSRTKLYPSWRTCNNDGIPLSHRGSSLLGSSFFDIIGLWHREDPRQRARLQIGGHSRRRTLDTLCMSLRWQSGRILGTGRVVYSRRKVSQESFDRARIVEEGRRPVYFPLLRARLNTNSILANIPRVQIVFDISRPLSKWD